MSDSKQLGRILALDIGKKRIGSAMSDELRLTSIPFKAFEIKGSLKVSIAEILECCVEKSVKLIIAGMPLELNGERGAQAKYTHKVISMLYQMITSTKPEDSKEEFPLNTLIKAGSFHLYLIDERFTSVQAEAQILSKKHKNKERREIKDNLSASILLETYLNS